MSDQYPTQPGPQPGWAQPPPQQPDPTQRWAQPPPAGPATRPKPPFYRRGWFPLVTFIVGALVGAGSAGGGSDPQATPRTVTVTSVVYRPQPTSIQKVPGPGQATTTTPKPTAAPAITLGDGVYEVGAEIKPGTYKTRAEGDPCYWARLADPDGSNILANHIGTGLMTLRVRSSDKYIELSGGCEWRKVA